MILLNIWFQYLSLKPSILVVILLVFTTLTLFCYEDMHLRDIYAASPPFVRHEIKDLAGIYDIEFRNDSVKDGKRWQPVPKNFTLYTNNTEKDLYSFDIESVSYFSDGKTLNATFWFPSDDRFIDRPTKYAATYAMYIDVDSDNKTGSSHGPGGADYSIKAIWKPHNEKWEKIFAEESVSRSYRILNYTDEETGLFSRENPSDHINLSIDLNAIGSPDQFLVTFEGEYDISPSSESETLLGGENYLVKDIFPWISIPEPKFVLTLSPSTLTIKPGEEKIVEIKINSNVNLKSVANLSKEKTTEYIESLVNPPKVTIPPNGIGTSYLYVKATDSAQKQTYTFPIYQTLSFPSKHINYTDAIVNTGYLTIIVQHYPLSERFKDFWSTYGDALSLVGGGFAGGFSGFIFAKLEKKKKNDEDNQ
jgi:hypothetical protein